MRGDDDVTESSGRLRLVVVDDHQMFRDLVLLRLGEREDIELVGIAGTAEEALELCEAECPDVVLMDVSLPGMSGIEATRKIKEDLCPDAAVVILTAHVEADVVVRAVEAGASGYVTKNQAMDDLVRAVKAAANGEMSLPSGDLVAILQRLTQARSARAHPAAVPGNLSIREIQVLQGFAVGKSTGEVAAELSLSPLTVKSHVRSILAKLGMHSKLDAVLFALRNDLIQLEPEAEEPPSGDV